jgi:simple sugar transport system permease protein
MWLMIWGMPLIPAALVTLAIGAVLGLCIGAIVVYGKISSLVATLGLSFFIIGIVNFLAQGKNLELRDAVGTWGNTFFVGKWNVFGTQVPNHFILSLIWVVLMYVLFRYHRFGIRVQMVGDNPNSARQMGINVELIRVGVFVLSSVAAALCGVILVQTANMVWFPLSGKAYLLPVLAAIFVGGTPVWGGLHSWQAAAILRDLAGIHMVGGDIVEVSPPYDTTGATAIAGAHVAYELICLYDWYRNRR